MASQGTFRRDTVVFTDKAMKALPVFSQAIKANNILYVSGNVGMDPVTGNLPTELLHKPLAANFAVPAVLLDDQFPRSLFRTRHPKGASARGSFGGYSSPVRNALRHYQDAAEAEPDRFIRYVFPEILRRSRSLLADFMRCPMDELVLCPNVTTATNTVLLNIRWEDGDKIVYTSGVYGALEKTIEAIMEAQPSDIEVSGGKSQLDMPLASEKIVALFREALKHEKLKCKQAGKGRVRLAVFDTIISLPGLLMPFEEMVQVCREEGVLSMIDAAHGIGHIPLNLGKLDPDFFVTNCHKWLFTPRSVAAFYVPKRNQHMIRTTLPTSHGFRPLAARQVFDPMPS
ncbi:aminotransferase [Colletotrichum salicis]|uniref:Aminotransferase n=1 Tax=Colletotrichum salicis TaxID=1209931 RepID=A0A135ST76_9PEZI|nr:aminotransferase [Colletotrichum salicis]